MLLDAKDYGRIAGHSVYFLSGQDAEEAEKLMREKWNRDLPILVESCEKVLVDLKDLEKDWFQGFLEGAKLAAQR